MNKKTIISLVTLCVLLTSFFFVSAKPYENAVNNQSNSVTDITDARQSLYYNAWSPQFSSFGLDTMHVMCLASTEHYLYVGTDSDGLYRKDLLQQNSMWEQIGFNDEWVSTVFVDPAFPQVIYVGLFIINEQIDPTGAPHSLFKSMDGGQMWTPIDTGFIRPDGDITYRIPVYCVRTSLGNPWILYATSSAQVFKSIDGGVHWSLIYGSLDIDGNGVHVITIAPSNPQILWLGGESGTFGGFVSKSTDGGATWTGVTPHLPGDNGCYNIVIHPQNPNIVYVGLEGKLARTTNGGQSWSFVLQPQECPYFRGLVIDELSPNKVYAGGGSNTPGSVLNLWGTDGTGPWTQSQTQNSGKTFALVLDRSNHQVIYAATEHGVWIGQISWQPTRIQMTAVTK
jgi:hypothetical protein